MLRIAALSAKHYKTQQRKTYQQCKYAVNIVGKTEA